jgi:hypothetical protein
MNMVSSHCRDGKNPEWVADERGLGEFSQIRSGFIFSDPRSSAKSAFIRVPFFVLLIACMGATVAAAAPDFDRDIRPILSDRCFYCHGPDAEQRQADMRLDTREGAIAAVIVPGKPDESELVRRITSDDPDERMPPPDSHLSLTDAEKQLLRAWIAEGAKYTEHWAFQPLPDEIAVPAARDEAWPRKTLDRFVLARLEAEQLEPSPAADPLRLLRRLSLDLTGLPPTVDEIRDFQQAAADNSDGAIEAAVDRLLASPVFGEHFAVAWLDAARYADSYGYQSDQLNTQWPYRDWVVRALNANMPYNEFLTEQIAGDLLPHPTRDQILATAFNRMHRMTNEGGSIAEEWLVENASDRVHTLGTAVLALTLECSRCHDHKFDPMTQRDYYSLSAFFNSIDENGMYDNAAKTPSPSLLLPTEGQEERLDATRREVEKAEAALAAAKVDGEARFQTWLGTAMKPSPSGRGQGKGSPDTALPHPSPLPEREEADLLRHVTFDEADVAADLPRVPGADGKAVAFDGDHGASFSKLLDVDRWQPFTLDLWLRDAARNPLPVVVAQQTRGTDVGYNGFDLMLSGGILEARLYRVWPGNAIGVRATKPIARNQWQRVTVSYDGSSRAEGLRLYLAGVELPTEILRNNIHKSVGVGGYGDGAFTLGERFRDRGFKNGAIDELRVYSRALTPIEVRHLHRGDAKAPSPPGRGQGEGNSGTRLALHANPLPEGEGEEELREFYFSAIDDQTRKLSAALQQARRTFVETEDAALEVSVMHELPAPRPAYILARGAYDAPKNDDNRVVRDTFAKMLTPFPADAPRNRLGLAQWITDPRHPLTARVCVNRLWANFFGRGFVATPENFGRQGAAPSHPELLDWLARDFVAHGWDVKRLCREIVLSATYRQDSRQRPELRERDPENVLLARGPSRRLSAEQIRDLALAASGLLDSTLGGPPVSPYQPGADLWRESNDMSPPYQQSTGKGLHRRSLYSVWKRTAPLPNMLAFDAGTREVCIVARSRTNTPLQALVLLNDVQFVEAARALAAEAAQLHAEPDDQIREAFLRLAGREPDEMESGLLNAIYKEQLELFAADAEQHAGAYLAVGEARPESKIAPADLAALTVTCQAILNLDATIYER